MNNNLLFISKYKREILFLSSGKAKEFADKIRQQLSDYIQNDPFLQNEYDCISWDNTNFLKKGYTTIDSMIKYAQLLRYSGGYAICIFYPDDILYKNADDNSNSYYVTRDNVIFELGLFLGTLGQGNALFIYCESANGKMVHIPTDLDSVCNFRYIWNDDTNGPEKNSERLIADDIFRTIVNSRKEELILNNEKSETIETTTKNENLIQHSHNNTFFKDKELKVKPQENDTNSLEIEKTIAIDSKEKHKDPFPKPLTRGL